MNQNGQVALERAVVPTSGLGLQATPLETHPMRRLPEASRAPEILFRAPLPPLSSNTGPAAVSDRRRPRFPFPPVVAVVVPLHLVRRRRRPPKKPSWKLLWDRGHL